MRKYIFLNIALLSLFALFFTTSLYAHPGRTATDGCHYCRTNCDRWGVLWYQRHCHGGGGSVEGIQESQPVNVEPTNTPIPWPTWTPIPTRIPTQTPISLLPADTPTPTITPTKSITPKVRKIIKKQQITKKQKKSFWQWLFGK